jgi:hypothetical protein
MASAAAGTGPEGTAVDVGGDGFGSLANSTTITFELAIRCAKAGRRDGLQLPDHLPDLV